MENKKIVVINKQSYGTTLTDETPVETQNPSHKKFYLSPSEQRIAKKKNFKTKWQGFLTKFRRWTRTKQAMSVLIFAVVAILAVSAVLIWGAVSKTKPSEHFSSAVSAYIYESVGGAGSGQYDTIKLSQLEKDNIKKSSARHYRSFELTAKTKSGTIAIENLYFMLYSQNAAEYQIKITIKHDKFTNDYTYSRTVSLRENKIVEFSLPIKVAVKAPNQNTTFTLEFIPTGDSTALDIAKMQFVS